jgi:hypothetical protein
MDTTWRALQVVANHEKRVVQHLTARSLEHYLPLYSQKITLDRSHSSFGKAPVSRLCIRPLHSRGEMDGSIYTWSNPSSWKWTCGYHLLH